MDSQTAHENKPAPTPESPSETGRIPVSCLILTKNEQVNMEAVLRTLSFSDDIVVLDSISDDDTVQIAKENPGPNL